MAMMKMQWYVLDDQAIEDEDNFQTNGQKSLFFALSDDQLEGWQQG